MAFASIQHGFSSGEMSPRLFGRTDLAKYSLGCSTLRNFYVDYRGGASTRAGLAYIGMCKQGAPNAGGTATSNPPRDIPFQFNISQGYALEFGDQYMRIKSDGAYVVEAAKSITAVTNANPAVFTSAAHGYSNGDWLFDTGFSNMLNNTVYAPNTSTNSLTIINDGVTSSASVGGDPEGICVSPDGSRAYVANFSDNTVSVINTTTLATIATIAVGTNPRGIAITTDGSEVYVANYGSNNVSVIATISNTVTHTILAGANPTSVGITPDGQQAYVTNFGVNTVTPITIATHTAGANITVGTDPYCASATPDSAHVYVTNYTDGTVKVIATASNTVTATITVGTNPIGVVVTPDGLHAYVANYTSGTVSVITIASNTVTATIAVNPNPVALAASSDSANVYVSIYSTGTASIIATATNTITGTLSTGSKVLSPQSIAVYSAIVQVQETDGFAALNGLTWIVRNSTANTYTLTDLFGNAVDSTAFGSYVSGASTERIYTVVSPYAAADLPFLKFTQSADTMTLTCVNQQSNAEYPSYELVRHGATNWTFTADSFASSISAPTGISVVANPSTTLSTFYSYVVTAVDAITGEESIASLVGTVENNDIAINAGSNVITWTGVSGASSYNVYAATPSYAVAVPTGAAFGYIGSSFGTQFTDTNIVADFTTVPPVHNDPFSRGEITSVSPTANGSSYTQAGVTYSIGTSTGSGGVIVPVVVNGGVVAYIVQNGGKLYQSGDTITITANGTGATATLNIGAESGTYPGTCAYYQQRRVYAFTLNRPDTYFMSQPGAYSNMDSSIPATDSDSITGAPWAQQINGIQFLVPMPGGLVILTGKGAWTLNGGTNAAITPADQTATPQAYNGCSFIVPPIVVNYDILYVQAKGSIVRDLSYNFFVNIYTGTDMTVLSEHLFNFHQLQQWAYAEEPYKIIWAIRDDGVMLSLTYLKEQDVYGWARHDTNGLFMGACSVTEPPVDAVYVITKRYIQGPGKWAYYSERMDNRNWQVVEDCFCVDAGLSLPMTLPNATLTPSAVDGTDNISSTLVAIGGSGYVAPVASAVDDTGVGNGASFSVTTVAGVITAVTPITQGQNYTSGSTRITITDSAGTGAVVYPVITNIVNFSASASVFTSNMIGDVIRIGNNNAPINSGFPITPNGGGRAVITSVFSGTNIAADIIDPITNVVANDPENTPIPVNANYWSLSTPVKNVSGLNHLEGMDVSCLADGSVVDGLTVTNGSITLPAAASQIVVGLGFTADLQTLYLDAPSPQTMQGQRKNVQAVTVRVENTRGLFVGSNQVDASTQPNNAAPNWTNMFEMKPRNSTNSPGKAIPLYTGDLRELIGGSWQKPCQIACQITDPLPGNILATIPEWNLGDARG